PADRWHDWSLSGQKIDGGEMRKASLLLVDRRASRAPVRLEAREALRIELDVGSEDPVDPKGEDKGGPRRQTLFFSAAQRPGVYELRATFSRHSGGGAGRGGGRGVSVARPPVRIEIQR